MIAGDTALEYNLVLAYSTLLTYWGLICVGYVVAAAAFGGAPALRHPFSIVVEVIAAIEVLWYLVWFLPYRARLQRTANVLNAEPLSREQRGAFLRRALELVPEPTSFIRRWAQNAHWDDIGRENIKDWLLWALFDRGGPPGDDDDELEEYVRHVEEWLGFAIRKGRGDCDVLRLSIDPVPMTHRSLMYYMVFGLFDMVGTAALFIMGFSFYRQSRSKFFTTFPLRPMGLLSWNASAGEHVSYFCRPHRSSTKRPILFIHGVGVGLLPYVRYFRTVPRDVGILAVELLPISSRICPPMARISDLTSSIAAALDQQGRHFDDVVVVAQSYGTLLVNSLLLSPSVAPKINSLVLADPVSMLLHFPAVAYNFTRRPLKKGRGDLLQLRYIALDPNVAHTLARRFSWRDLVLWRELLVADTDSLRTTVIIGENDCVTDPVAVASYVEYGSADHDSPRDRQNWAESAKRWVGSRQLELIWLPGCPHGGSLMNSPYIPTAARVATRYCAKDGDARLPGVPPKSPARDPVAQAGQQHASPRGGAEVGSIKSLY